MFRGGIVRSLTVLSTAVANAVIRARSSCASDEIELRRDCCSYDLSVLLAEKAIANSKCSNKGEEVKMIADVLTALCAGKWHPDILKQKLQPIIDKKLHMVMHHAIRMHPSLPVDDVMPLTARNVGGMSLGAHAQHHSVAWPPNHIRDLEKLSEGIRFLLGDIMDVALIAKALDSWSPSESSSGDTPVFSVNGPLIPGFPKDGTKFGVTHGTAPSWAPPSVRGKKAVYAWLKWEIPAQKCQMVTMDPDSRYLYGRHLVVVDGVQIPTGLHVGGMPVGEIPTTTAAKASIWLCPCDTEGVVHITIGTTYVGGQDDTATGLKYLSITPSDKRAAQKFVTSSSSDMGLMRTREFLAACCVEKSI
jgi:hypothetical protein